MQINSAQIDGIALDPEECRVALVRTDAGASAASTANVVPSSPILVTLKMEAIHSSEMPFLTRATRRNAPEDSILHSHHRENLTSYI
jgi:hypothetical protein